VYTWEVLADDFKQLTGVDRNQKEASDNSLEELLA